MVSKHHYALELSKNNQVVFLNPPGGSDVVEEFSKNLRVVNYRNVFRGINKLPIRLRRYFQGKQATKINKLVGIDHWDIIWTFDPFRFQDPGVFGSSTNIFHSVDIHKTHLDKQLAGKVDFVFTTSSTISQKYKIYNSNTFVINHGLASHFANMPNYQPLGGKVNVGYVGNLQYQYLDDSTLCKIVADNPNVYFHFAGPTSKSNLSSEDNNELIGSIKRMPNVKFHGEIPSAELPEFLSKCDFFLMCYNAEKYREEVANPHKLLEFLSTGRVVVSHFIDQYQGTDLFEMAIGQADLPKLFKKVLKNLEQYNSNSLSERRREFAVQNTYTNQIDRIQEILNA